MVKLDDVAVLDDVLFSFGSGTASFTGGNATFTGDHVSIADDFGANEPFLNIGMDFSGSYLGGGAVGDGPCPGLNFTGGQVGDEIEGREGGLDEAVESGLLKA